MQRSPAPPWMVLIAVSILLCAGVLGTSILLAQSHHTGGSDAGLTTATSSPLVAGVVVPSPATIDSGQSIHLTATPSGGATPYSFHWYESATGTGGCGGSLATHSTLGLVKVAPITPTFYCYVVKDAETPRMVAASPWAAETVNPTLHDSGLSPAAPSVDPGASVLLSSSPSGGTQPYHYSWYSSASNTGACQLGLHAGVTSSISVSPTTDTYYCYQVRDSATVHMETRFSGWVLVTVNGPLIPGAASVSQDPVDVGQSTTFSTTPASGGSGGFTYSWASSLPGCTSGSGLSFMCIPTPSISSTTSYSVTLTTSDSDAASSVQTVALDVAPDPTVSVGPAGPVFYDIGETASTLSADVTYAGINSVGVEWFGSPSPLCDATVVDTGVAGASFAPPTSSASATYYCAVVSDAGVPSFTSASNAVEVGIYGDPTVSVSPSGPEWVDLLSTPTEPTATVSYEGLNPVSVEWYDSLSSPNCGDSTYVDSGSSGTTFPLDYYAALVLSPISVYVCAVATETGGAETVAYSNSLLVEFITPPTVAVSPSTTPVSYAVGDSATALTATVTYAGTNPVSVQWYSAVYSGTTGPFVCAPATPWTTYGGSGASPLGLIPSTVVAGPTAYCAVATESGGDDVVAVTTVVVVEVGATTTDVACGASTIPVSSSMDCLATVSGVTGSIAGQTISWSFSGATVSFNASGLCTIGGTSCSIQLSTASTTGTTIVYASYGGDFYNAPSVGAETITVETSGGGGGGGGGGGCVLAGTLILTPTGYVAVQNLTVGATIEEYDFANQTLVNGTFVSGATTNVTQLIDVNNGFLYLTPTEQPMFIENASFIGWLHDPQNLTTSDRIFDPVSFTWSAVTSVALVNETGTVYDVVTSGANNFVASGALLDYKN